MQIEEALRTLVRLIEATAQRPFGLVALLAFGCTTAAYLVLRDAYPRVSGKLIWLVLASLIGVSVAVSQTLRVTPSVGSFSAAGAPLWSTRLPASGEGADRQGGSPSFSGTSGSLPSPRSTAAPSPGDGVPGAPERFSDGSRATTAPASAGAPPVPGGTSAGVPAPRPLAASPDSGDAAPLPPMDAASQPPPGSPSGLLRDDGPAAWIASGTAVQEVSTRDHRCPDGPPGAVTCHGVPTRGTYRLQVEATASERLSRPELRCVEGPCGSSAVNFTRLSADGRLAEASFDVWGGPTRWRLTAVREVRAQR